MFNTLGARLKELRDEAGYSQEYVAEELGMSQRQIWDYEHDVHAPQLDRFQALMDFYGVEIPILKGAHINARGLRRSN